MRAAEKKKKRKKKEEKNAKEENTDAQEIICFQTQPSVKKKKGNARICNGEIMSAIFKVWMLNIGLFGERT